MKYNDALFQVMKTIRSFAAHCMACIQMFSDCSESGTPLPQLICCTKGLCTIISCCPIFAAGTASCCHTSLQCTVSRAWTQQCICQRRPRLRIEGLPGISFSPRGLILPMDLPSLWPSSSAPRSVILLFQIRPVMNGRGSLPGGFSVLPA